MLGPDEYDQLVSRNFQPYSQQHRQLYETIAEFLKGKPADILEVGTGIGYGLKRLLQNGCIKSYLGIEPSGKCFNYLNKIYDVPIMNKDFMDCAIKEPMDFSLCIEVIEHLEKPDLVAWFKKMRQYTKVASFISTPDKETDSHGIFSKEYVRDCLINAGYAHVVLIEWQKPHTLFVAEV